MGEFGAQPHSAPREMRYLVSGQTQGTQTLTEPGKAVLAHPGDVVVGEIQVAEILQLVEGSRHVVEAVPLHVQELERVLQPREGVNMNETDPVHAKIDPPG